MYALNAIRYGGVLMSDWKDNAVKDEYGNPDISLCKNCWCMTHTLVGNVCGKCKRPKHITKEEFAKDVETTIQRVEVHNTLRQIAESEENKRAQNIIGDENIGGESMSMKEFRRRQELKRRQKNG